ncbi:DNA-binding response regulator [Leifsonia sp. LS1]|uniref:response regulator n=1 Tax=unclassified Leifsonia TaxID=2663824 RepID=UPI001CC14797|nr:MULTISPECIES: response regulator transcription factor [unclassified Leifsonia]UAJ79870.1 response regulator transcription factor [Leifsonia sp. ZF2019]GIT81239.1 DNA-binding response regulator [Leifsonia sp. LS1]
MTDTSRTVVLIDDHSVFRQGIRALIEGRFDIVGEGGTSDDAWQLVAVHAPDVLLLDVEIPGVAAEQTVSRLRRHHPETAIVILTMHSDAVLERQLLRAGAAEFVTKNVDSEQLIAVIARATPPLGVPGDITADDEIGATILTVREQEVLRMIAQAYSNRDIATMLSIAEGTVKRHTTNMYEKLGATSRIDAVRKAARLGLLS